MDILEQYLNEFNELPPTIIGIDFEDDFYKNILMKAIETKKKVTKEQLDKELDKIQYDLVQNDFDADEETDYE